MRMRAAQIPGSTKSHPTRAQGQTGLAPLRVSLHRDHEPDSHVAKQRRGDAARVAGGKISEPVQGGDIAAVGQLLCAAGGAPAWLDELKVAPLSTPPAHLAHTRTHTGRCWSYLRQMQLAGWCGRGRGCHGRTRQLLRAGKLHETHFHRGLRAAVAWYCWFPAAHRAEPPCFESSCKVAGAATGGKGWVIPHPAGPPIMNQEEVLDEPAYRTVLPWDTAWSDTSAPPKTLRDSSNSLVQFSAWCGAVHSAVHGAVR